jgi:hypothetical protein
MYVAATALAAFLYYFSSPRFCALWLWEKSLQTDNARVKRWKYLLEVRIVFLKRRNTFRQGVLPLALCRLARRQYRRVFLNKVVHGPLPVVGPPRFVNKSHKHSTDQGRFLDVARQTGQKNRGGGGSGRPGLPMKAYWD